MSTLDEANQLLMGGGGPPSFKFENVGDTLRGTITDVGVRQATDFVTKQPKFYSDGNPIRELVVTWLADDGEEYRTFCNGEMRRALREAVVEAGAESLQVGGRGALQHSGLEPQSTPGLSPKKLFKAQYKPPANSVSADDLL